MVKIKSSLVESILCYNSCEICLSWAFSCGCIWSIVLRRDVLLHYVKTYHLLVDSVRSVICRKSTCYVGVQQITHLILYTLLSESAFCTSWQSFASCMNFIILVERRCTCFFDLRKFYVLALLYLKFFTI